MTTPLRFFVPGVPVAKGSARAFLAKNGRPIVLQDNRERQRPWASLIATTAMGAWNAPPTDGPVRVTLAFVFRRPKIHFGKRGLRPSAPREHVKRPDLDKTVRLVLDSLTHVVWEDDAQVVAIEAWKAYTTGGGAGLLVEVRSVCADDEFFVREALAAGAHTPGLFEGART